MDTNELFRAITDGRTVEVQLSTRTEFDTLRTGLLRRYTRWAEQFSNLGDDTPSQSYVSSVFNADTKAATFQLKSKDDMKRKPRSYVVKML